MITLHTLFTASAIVMACEGSAFFLRLFLSPLETTLIIRCFEITGMILLLKYSGDHHKNGFQYSWLSRNLLKQGMKCGLLWSLLSGAVVLISGFSFFLITGSDPLKYLLFVPPGDARTLFLFLLTGGMVSPIAEEIFFRGILYSFFRKYGVTVAVLISTALFTLCHFRGDNLPIVQLIGGVLFALAFERSGSILSPMIIHILGNMAIFSISIFH